MDLQDLLYRRGADGLELFALAEALPVRNSRLAWIDSLLYCRGCPDPDLFVLGA